MEVKFTIPTAHTTRIIDGVCYEHHYQAEVPDPDNPEKVIPNPETKAQFAKKMIVQWVKNCVKSYEGVQAAHAARDEKIAEVEAINIT